MATNKHSDGGTVPYANSSGSTITSGTIVVIASGDDGRCGIAVNDILDGETGDLAIEGVFAVPAEAGTWAQGALIYYDVADEECNDDATGNIPIGWAWLEKDSDTTGYVKLER